MKKTLVEGFEFVVRELNFNSDHYTAWTLVGGKANRIVEGRGYDVSMVLEATIPFDESGELMDALKNGRAVVVVKR